MADNACDMVSDDVTARIEELRREAVALRAAGDKLGALMRVREMKALKERRGEGFSEGGTTATTTVVTVAALKAQAIALREAGDKVGALQKVREMKALQTAEAAAAAQADGPSEQPSTTTREEKAAARDAGMASMASEAGVVQDGAGSRPSAGVGVAKLATAAAGVVETRTVQTETAQANNAVEAATREAHAVIEGQACDGPAYEYEPYAPMEGDAWDDRSSSLNRSDGGSSLDRSCSHGSQLEGLAEESGSCHGSYHDNSPPASPSLVAAGAAGPALLAGLDVADLDLPGAKEKVQKVREAIADLLGHVAQEYACMHESNAGPCVHEVERWACMREG